MDLQCFATAGMPSRILRIVSGPEVLDVFYAALAHCFGIRDAKERPAAFSTHTSVDTMGRLGDNHGIKIVVEGVSRNTPGRTEAQIRAFGQAIFDYVVSTVVMVLSMYEPGQKVDVFVVLELDGPLGDTKSHLLEFSVLVDGSTPPPSREDTDTPDPDHGIPGLHEALVKVAEDGTANPEIAAAADEMVANMPFFVPPSGDDDDPCEADTLEGDPRPGDPDDFLEADTLGDDPQARYGAIRTHEAAPGLTVLGREPYEAAPGLTVL